MNLRKKNSYRVTFREKDSAISTDTVYTTSPKQARHIIRYRYPETSEIISVEDLNKRD